MKIIPHKPEMVNGLMQYGADFVYTREEFLAEISKPLPSSPTMDALKRRIVEAIEQDITSASTA